jgi:hypothetical protein
MAVFFIHYLNTEEKLEKCKEDEYSKTLKKPHLKAPGVYFEIRLSFPDYRIEYGGLETCLPERQGRFQGMKSRVRARSLAFFRRSEHVSRSGGLDIFVW